MNARVLSSLLPSYLLILIGGCASQPTEIQAVAVSPVHYQNFDCPQIGQEVDRVGRRTGELYTRLKKTADNDAAQMGVGLVLFWPALFFLEGGDGAEAAEYARLKGEFEALQQAAVARQCDLGAPRTLAYYLPADAASDTATPAPQNAPQPTATAAGALPGEKQIQLDEMRKDGVITEEQHAQMTQQLVARSGATQTSTNDAAKRGSEGPCDDPDFAAFMKNQGGYCDNRAKRYP